MLAVIELGLTWTSKVVLAFQRHFFQLRVGADVFNLNAKKKHQNFDSRTADVNINTSGFAY